MYLHLLHQAFFGAAAAVGFGVLFNIGPRVLVWCAVSGALALSVRTICQDIGWALEAASFAAALTASCAVCILRGRLKNFGNSVALTGCIPMVPGAFMAQGLLGLFAVTAPHSMETTATIVEAMQYMLRVIFTVGAIGAGLAIPTHLFRNRDY